jgi:hypothetical protein
VDSANEVGNDPSLAIDSSGYPHISYLNSTFEDLKYARWDGSEWVVETVANAGAVGYGSSLALDSADNPSISYIDGNPTYDIKFAHRSGSSWISEPLDSSSSVAHATSLGLDSSGNPHVCYVFIDYNDNTADLKYARKNGNSWDIEAVYPGGAGFGSSLALDSSDIPHISFFDWENFDLNYTWRNR